MPFQIYSKLCPQQNNIYDIYNNIYNNKLYKSGKNLPAAVNQMSCFRCGTSRRWRMRCKGPPWFHPLTPIHGSGLTAGHTLLVSHRVVSDNNSCQNRHCTMWTSLRQSYTGRSSGQVAEEENDQNTRRSVSCYLVRIRLCSSLRVRNLLHRQQEES